MALSEEILQILKKKVGAEHILSLQNIQQKLMDVCVELVRITNSCKYTSLARGIIDNTKRDLDELRLLNEIAQHAAGVTVKTAKELGIEVEEKQELIRGEKDFGV